MSYNLPIIPMSIRGEDEAVNVSFNKSNKSNIFDQLCIVQKQADLLKNKRGINKSKINNVYDQFKNGNISYDETIRSLNYEKNQLTLKNIINRNKTNEYVNVHKINNILNQFKNNNISFTNARKQIKDMIATSNDINNLDSNNLKSAINKINNYIDKVDNVILKDKFKSELNKILKIKNGKIKNQPLKEKLNKEFKDEYKGLKTQMNKRAIKLNRKMSNKTKEEENNEFDLTKQNFNGMLKVYNMTIFEERMPTVFINDYKNKIYDLINNMKNDSKSEGITYQMRMMFEVEFPTNLEKKNLWKRSERQSIINVNKIDVINEIKKISNVFDSKIEDIEIKGSGAVYKCTKEIEIVLFPYEPLKGSSYISLPPFIANKQAVINVKNNDDKCFKWAVLSALHPVNGKNHPERVINYVPFDNLKFDNIDFPVSIDNINKFENLNDISINVFSFEQDKDDKNKYVIYTRVISKMKCDKHVNLLLIENADQTHYVWIKNMSALLNGQYNNHSHKLFYCLRCVNGFSSEEKLNNHIKYCEDHDYIKTKLPKADGKSNILKFNHVERQQKIPYKIYCDFEAINEKINNNNENEKTIKITNHKISGYCIVLSNTITNESKVYHYSSANESHEEIFNRFASELFNIKENIEEKYKYENAVPIIMTAENNNDFNNAEQCYMCNKIFGSTFINKFNKKIIITKVRDHCHFTGKYRGAACQACNLKFRVSKVIPVIFHNLRGYDSHFIFQNLGLFLKDRTDYANVEISAIPTNIEKYLSFTISTIATRKEDKYKSVKLRFIDSLQFMGSSIDELAKNLSDNKKILTQKHLLEYGLNNDKINLIMKKGIFPYSWFDNLNKLNNTCLPNQSDFFNDLKNEHISDDDYNHAIKVWESFNIKTFKEYHDIYMMLDTLLLADIYNEFVETCLNNYKVDPGYYLSAPGMSMDAFLNYGTINNKPMEIELLTDCDQYLFFEKMIRGGVSTIFKRYAKANNKYLIDYDKSKPSTYIIYLDANNLYGWAMSQKLPYSDYSWDDVNNWNQNKIINYDFENSDYCYTFNVDLEYPHELHDIHDYPLAPESIFIENDKLSLFQNNLIDEMELKRVKTHKLIPNLNNKYNYVINGRLLKLNLELGMKIMNIHKVHKARQDYIIRDYINENTKRRAAATSEFHKDYYKLLNNSIYGKTLENVRGHRDVKILSDNQYNKFRKLNTKNRIKDIHVYNSLVACELRKLECELNKPIHIGATILDLSKYLMYDFYYNNLKVKYGNDCHILATDTDSLILEIQTEDLYKDIMDNRIDYDLSDMKIKEYCNNDNKKVIGKFKDETNGIPIKEFVGLRSKMYSILYDDIKNKLSINDYLKMQNDDLKEINKKTCKGTKKYVVKQQINHQNYKNILFMKDEGQTGIMINENVGIRSLNHNITTQKQMKISLNCFDDKMFLINTIEARPHGHKNNQN